MITLQNQVLRTLKGKGFSGHRTMSDGAVMLQKRTRPWLLKLAQVGTDGSVNGETLSEFLKAL